MGQQKKNLTEPGAEAKDVDVAESADLDITSDEHREYNELSQRFTGKRLSKVTRKIECDKAQYRLRFMLTGSVYVCYPSCSLSI